MRKTYIIAVTIAVSMFVSITAVAVPPMNDVCDTGAIVINQATCASVTDFGNCAKNKSTWCSPLFAECANGEGLCIPILDDNNVELNNLFDCDIVPTDNTEATTDGQAMEDFSTCSGSFFGSDVWWRVVAPCNGLMSVSMCGGSSYDAMMAAYDVCPQGPSAPTVVACNDDGCGTTSDISELEPFRVIPGQEVTIRVGGWAGTPGSPVPAAQGPSQLHIRFACSFSFEIAFLSPLSGEAGYMKDRYISLDPSWNSSTPMAIRVMRVGSTREMYVDCTSLEDKGDDGWYAELIDGPLPPSGNTTYYCPMNLISELHIRGCSIVPGNTYWVAGTFNSVDFSTTLLIDTTPPQTGVGRSFGDLVGGFVGGIWTAPDNLVTANDIVAVVQKFSLVPNAPIIARVDTDGAVPNGLVAGNDILRVVLGFSGSGFGFGVTDCLTGTCVPPQGGACE